MGDAGIEKLAGLTQLELLGLKGTPVTDSGICHLREMKGLRELLLSGCKLTDASKRRLAEALPNAHITP